MRENEPDKRLEIWGTGGGGGMIRAPQRILRLYFVQKYTGV